jgi:hypothetical protein
MMFQPQMAGSGLRMASRRNSVDVSTAKARRPGFKAQTRRLAAAAALLASVLAAPPAHAGPSDYVSSPTVEAGEFEVDFKAGSARLGDRSNINAQSLGLGYGVNSFWFTEFYAKWHGANDGSVTGGHSFDAFEWENRFQLTETGKYPVDVGFLLEIERPRDRAEGIEVVWGPLLQAEFGRMLGNLNLLVSKNYRAAEAAPASLTYQWQLRAPVAERVDLGVQGFGNLGRWDKWAPHAEQEHSLGPAVFGKLELGAHQAIKYNAGWLVGLTDASARHTVRLQVEWEM